MPDFSVERLAPVSDDQRQYRQLVTAVVLSVAVHLLFLGAAWQQFTQHQAVSTPNPLSIGLVPQNPLRAEVPAFTEEIAVIEAEPVLLPGPVRESEPPRPVPDVESSAVTPAQVTDSQAVQPVPESAPTLPSLITVRDSVTSLNDARTGEAWQWDCNRLEESAGVIHCGETNPNENLDYQSLERNQAYRALNPVREVSRGQQTVATFANEAPQLAARLVESGLPPGMSGYLIQQMESGISLYSFQEKQSLRTLHELTASPVEQMAARVLADPWVVNYYHLRAQRQRQVIPLSPAENLRNSIINLGLIWLNMEMNTPSQ